MKLRLEFFLLTKLWWHVKEQKAKNAQAGEDYSRRGAHNVAAEEAPVHI